eukprot:27930-Hanusia_phi.AAC.1
MGSGARGRGMADGEVDVKSRTGKDSWSSACGVQLDQEDVPRFRRGRTSFQGLGGGWGTQGGGISEVRKGGPGCLKKSMHARGKRTGGKESEGQHQRRMLVLAAMSGQ